MSKAFMQEAIRLAREGSRAGKGGPFGAVVVKDGEIIGSGENRVLATGDPTAHAEVVAIRAACARLETHQLAGCEIFCSCEPCPMCRAAIHWARLDGVTYAAGRKDAAAIGFDDERLHDLFAQGAASDSATQMLRAEAVQVMQEWLSWDDRTVY